uniref:Uncharacterized protein n=1 Tax=Oryza nivara TaxID=4536 RepID=A0A0E0GQT2_ORYNI
MHGIILSWICDLPAFLALLWVPVVERGGARLFCPKRERPKKKKNLRRSRRNIWLERLSAHLIRVRPISCLVQGVF